MIVGLVVAIVAAALLASGSRDTDVVVWDVAAEAGLFRLRGHRDQVLVCVRVRV